MAVQFFVVTLLALRKVNNAIEAGVNSLLVMEENQAAAQQVAEREMTKRFPSMNGRIDPQIVVFPVPPVVEDEGYRLTWQIEKTVP